MKRLLVVTLPTLFLVTSGGCTRSKCAADPASCTDKGSESTMPALDGKSDTWWAPTLHGDIRWGETDLGTFDGEAKFHAWDFTLLPESTANHVTLTTEPQDPNVDTVAYLYRWDESKQSWGHYLARNDDHAGGIGSEIAKNLDAGAYRVVIKGYKDKVRGTFAFVGTCEGSGCEAKGPPNDLAPKEEATVVAALDALCGDTYCAGDFDWRTVSVVCAWGTGCTVTLDAQSYAPEDAFPGMDWLDRYAPDQLTATGRTTDGDRPYVVTVERMVDRASAGLWARTTCELAVPYAGIDDLVGARGEPTTGFGDDVNDCVASLEEILWKVVPSALAP